MKAGSEQQLELWAEVAVVNGFGETDPDIKQAEAGDHAADGAGVQDVRERGSGEDEGIVIPDARPPGEHGNEDAEVDTEEDKDEERQALKPNRGEAAERRTGLGVADRTAALGGLLSRAGRCGIGVGKMKLLGQAMLSLVIDLSRGAGARALRVSS